MTFAQAIEALKRRGIPQKEMALYLEVSVGMISQYKTGVASPPIETAHKIVEFIETRLGLKTTIDQLFPRKESRPDVQAQ